MAAGWGADVRRWQGCISVVLLCVLASNANAENATAQRIFIVSDSTASDYGPERAPRTGWGQVLTEYFDSGVAIHNHAQSGRSSRSFIQQGFLKPIERELATGDLLLIQFGHNDEKIDDATRYNEPHAAFPRWLMRYIDLARARDAVPILITPVARRLFEHGKPVDSHALFAQAVRQLAESRHIALIDLNASSMRLISALGDNGSKHYYLYDPVSASTDNTHFNRHGASAIACLVAGALVEQQPALAKHARRDFACGADIAQVQVHPALVEHERDQRIEQPGPHGGAGSTTAYNFFREAPDLGMVLRKRVLHSGASIGPHRNNKDEIFYVISGEGFALVDGQEHALRAGSALLSRTGGLHAIHQSGAADLVLLITYQSPQVPVLPPAR